MADNVNITAGSGTAIAADDISSVWYQRIKLSLGADGSAVDAIGGAGAVSSAVQRMTLASDDPAVTHLAAIETAVELIDNAISGSEMQVDVVGALPAGDNNIGNVDIVTVPADPFGADADAASTSGSISAKLRSMAEDIDGATYSEDAAAPATITGGTVMMERDDALATLTPIEGDWVAARSTAEGALWTQDFNSDGILADTGTIAGAVSGSEMQVDVVAALPAGDNNIGNVDLASAIPAGANAIGSVGVDSLPTDPMGANADAASVSGSISAKMRSIATDLNAALSGSELQVDIVAALPSGSNVIGALAAADGTDIGDVDVASVPTDPFGANADAASSTGSISAKLRQLATDVNAVRSGSELQVDIVGSLPAGTNAIGTLAANSGVDIGDVDVISLVPGTGATALGKAEDAAHTGGDTGVAILGVRRDSKASGAGSDGDYATLNLNDSGDLRVDGGQVYTFENAPTVTAGAYTADDCIGGEIEITSAARVSGGSGVIMHCVVGIEDNDADAFVADDLDVLIFKSNPAGTYTDNTALAVSDADAWELEGSFTLDEKFDCGNVSLLQASNINMPYTCDATSLWAVIVNRGGKTPEATDALQIRFKMLRD